MYVPVGPRSLSIFEEAGALLLADGGLRPGANLWMPDGMPLNCVFRKPELGSLDSNVHTEGRQDCVYCGYYAHTALYLTSVLILAKNRKNSVK